LITVCIPTFNGARYIGDQLESILFSPLVSEVLVSDDGSEDQTIDIVESFNDKRIRVVRGPGQGLIKNYEYLFSLAARDYIFLADQDDVWLPNKVEVMLQHLQDADMVVCDCMVVDEQLNLMYPSFFSLQHSRPGLFYNLLRNHYLGCCMAFRKSLLTYALPFPRNLPMHDWWLGLIAEAFGKVDFVNQQLVMHRRHGGNASPTSERSKVPMFTRLRWRAGLAIELLGRSRMHQRRIKKARAKL